MPPIPFRGNPMGKLLPAGYTRVEYLESTGTQYINTGILGSNTLGWSITYSTVDSHIKDNGICGSRKGDVRQWLNEDYDIEVGWGGYINTGVLYSSARKTVTVNLYNSRIAKIAGIKTIWLSVQEDTGYPFVFFARAANGVVFQGRMKIYDLILTRDQEIIAHFIPAKDPSGVPCMYDTVTKQPFYNQGTGTFVTP